MIIRANFYSKNRDYYMFECFDLNEIKIAWLKAIKEDEGMFRITHIFVDEKYRRQKLATKMYQFAKEYMKKRNLKLIHSSTFSPEGLEWKLSLKEQKKKKKKEILGAKDPFFSDTLNNDTSTDFPQLQEIFLKKKIPIFFKEFKKEFFSKNNKTWDFLFSKLFKLNSKYHKLFISFLSEEIKNYLLKSKNIKTTSNFIDNLKIELEILRKNNLGNFKAPNLYEDSIIGQLSKLKFELTGNNVLNNQEIKIVNQIFNRIFNLALKKAFHIKKNII